MSPFAEVPIPPKPEPPPESLPEHVVHFTTLRDLTPRTYVHYAYEWIDKVASGEIPFGAEVIKQEMGGVPFTLVLFPRPVRFVEDNGSFTYRAMAAILREERVGGRRMVTGWMIDNHEEAKASFDLALHPEKADDLPDDCFPYQEDHDEDDDG